MLSLAASLVLAAVASGAPYGPESPTTTAATATNTIFMKADKKGLRFEGPKTIVSGEELTIVNKSNPKQVGPHTFSLVTQSSLPKTPKTRQLCFTKGHICMAIAGWHGVKGNGPVKTNPVDVGEDGWDTAGSVSKKGDSWFTGEKPGTSIVQQITADTSAGPSTLYYICAVHSFMQGKITVLPGG